LQKSTYATAMDLLAKPVKDAATRKGFTELTLPQEKAIPRILQGKNVLLIAPTASGKTEAALLPVLSMLILEPERRPGIKALYITPLRSLNRDMLERIEYWCGELDLRVGVRHGDTEQAERTRQSRSPPDLLITTPETLQAILSGRILRGHFASLRWVVVDEVHELAIDKRGSQLALALERVRDLFGKEFQIIGLSATVGTPDKIASYLVGSKRKVEIVHVPIARLMKFTVKHVQAEPQDTDLASQIYTHPEVAARLRFIRNLVETHKSTLVFVNTRSTAEVLSSRFKVWDVNLPIGVHHGSLSKPSRIAAEKGLKGGELKGLISTSSLELGIDIGHVDLVVQHMSPRQVTRLTQRVGRAGHRIGLTAKGIIITADPDDTLEAMVIARKALKEDLEPALVPTKPLDVLCHQIAALLMLRRNWKFDEILTLYKQAYPYRALTKKDLKFVLDYMHSRYPRLAWVDPQDEVVIRPRNSKALYEYFFEELSTIPDEKHYLVVEEKTDAPLGVLDEVFIAEYGDEGVKFVFRGSLWQIKAVLGDRVYVESTNDPTGAIPSWVGEEIPVPLQVASEVGSIRRRAEESILKTGGLRQITTELESEYPADKETIHAALTEIRNQCAAGYPVPSDKRIIIERAEDLTVIHLHLGTLANRTVARLIAYKLAGKLGEAVGIQQDAYRIILQSLSAVKLEWVQDALQDLAKDDVADLVERLAERSGLFRRRLIHVARRFGALSKYSEQATISLSRLMDAFRGSPIYAEALKEFSEEDLDVEAATLFLQRLKQGEYEIEIIDKKQTTPLGATVLERISRKTELIPPDRMQKILLESTRARLLNEVRIMACTECWKWVESVRVIDLPDHPRCPNCSSQKIAALDTYEETVRKLAQEMEEEAKLDSDQQRLLERAKESAKLIETYGKPAVVAIAGRRIRLRDVEPVVKGSKKIDDELINRVIEAEREALKRGF
jgi:ATP-dependent helicase Lhr and Lhr-like helicase